MGKGDVGRRGARIIKLVVELDVVARALQCEKRGPQLGRLRAQTAHGERTKQKRPTAARGPRPVRCKTFHMQRKCTHANERARRPQETGKEQRASGAPGQH